MGTFLFDAPVFGPVNSRRLGVSLGINLLPKDGKVCSFNCIYCECGLNEERRSISKTWSTSEEVKQALESRLSGMKKNQDALNVITFAGNGEPSLHPQFLTIIKDTVALRDMYFPKVKISVLSNAAHLDRGEVFDALQCVDNNILKLDSAIVSTFQIINNAKSIVDFDAIVPNLARFDGKVILQTLFCKGIHNGQVFDNTTEAEVSALIEAYRVIKPESIMIYSLSRDTPIDTIETVDKPQLNLIADKLRAEGFTVEVA